MPVQVFIYLIYLHRKKIHTIKDEKGKLLCKREKADKRTPQRTLYVEHKKNNSRDKKIETFHDNMSVYVPVCGCHLRLMTVGGGWWDSIRWGDRKQRCFRNTPRYFGVGGNLNILYIFP